MPGDGASWLINAIANLLQSKNISKLWIGWWHELTNGQLPDMTAIVRVHEFDPVLAAKADHIFCGLRDLRDAVAAGHRLLNIPADKTLADNLLSCAQAWEDWADVSTEQEELLQNPKEALSRLANVLAVELPNPDPVVEELANLLSENNGSATDAVGQYTESLASNELAAIEADYQQWLTRHGYKISVDPTVLTALAEEAGYNKTEQEVHPDFQEDYEKLGILKKLGFKPRVILDVGASTGPWSHTCARHFPHAIYNLVEALPHKHTAMVHPIDNQQWFMFPVALGAKVGKLELVMPTDGFGVYEASAFWREDRERPTERTQVPLETIDHLVATKQMKIPDVVKLDVQGYELEVLRGGDCLWGQTEMFVVETSLYRFEPEAPTLYEVMEFFEARDYMFFDFAGSYRAGRAGILAQLDLVFIPKNGRIASLIKF